VSSTTALSGSTEEEQFDAMIFEPEFSEKIGTSVSQV